MTDVLDKAREWLLAHRPDRRQVLRALPVALPLLVLGGFMVRNLDTPDFPHYEVPEGFTPAPPPASDPTPAPGELAAVDGTTSTSPTPPIAGTARLHGIVTVPEGAVPGATVRIERFIRDEVQAFDVLTGPDGTYDAGGIGGGRYRVRAFLPPTLGQAEAQVFFLPDGEDRALDLTMERFGQVELSIAVAPDPPSVDGPINVLVVVRTRQVELDGYVRARPLPGATVDLAVSGPWVAASTTTPPAPRISGADGTVRASFVCRSASGPASVTATVALGAGQPPATQRVDVAACIPASPQSTPTAPTSTTTSRPGSGSTTTTEPD